jgi:pyruvate, water dikinase
MTVEWSEHLVADPDHLSDFAEGDVLVTSMTDPAWEPIKKRAAAIIIDCGVSTLRREG